MSSCRRTATAFASNSTHSVSASYTPVFSDELSIPLYTPTLSDRILVDVLDKAQGSRVIAGFAISLNKLRAEEIDPQWFNMYGPCPNPAGLTRSIVGDAVSEVDSSFKARLLLYASIERVPAPKHQRLPMILSKSTMEEIEPEAQDGGGDDGDDDLPSVAAALQEACVELGYDETNAKRKELIGKLAGCEGSRDFPPDILSLVVHKTKREEREVIDELREQVQAVVSSMGVAIFEAEQEQYKKDAPIRAKIKEMALCPAGFDWHRDGNGWRCNGGSHFISSADIPGVNAE